VELLELKRLGAKGKRAPFGNDLDRGAQVLKLGALVEVGNVDLEIAGGDHVERARHHADGRLLCPGVARAILDREGVPVERPLFWVSKSLHRPVKSRRTHDFTRISKRVDLDGPIFGSGGEESPVRTRGKGLPRRRQEEHGLEERDTHVDVWA